MFSKSTVRTTVLSILTLLPLVSGLPSTSSETSLQARQGGYDTGIWIFTFYGWPDSFSPSVDCVTAANHNPPEGSNTVAYPGCVHLGNARGQFAGGSGSYANPLTAAANQGSTPIPICGVFYSPYLQKFLIYEDDCPSCTESTPHFDVWIGGSATDNNLNGVCNCEDTLTPANLRACAFWHFNGDAISELNSVANTGDLWNGGSGTCNTGILDYYWSENDSGLNTRCGPS